MWFVCFLYNSAIVSVILVEVVQLLVTHCVCCCAQDANERLKPVPSIPGDRETLLRLLDRRQQEVDRLTGKPCSTVIAGYCSVCIIGCVSLSCVEEWRNMLNKLETANAEKSNTQSKLDEIMLQDSSTKVKYSNYVYVCVWACVSGVRVYVCVCLYVNVRV